ncbi:hypothetical protein J4G37_45675, partial [Microvirga sp. 3-52]|nr:hypothetical protein [Microvirga sp. 3-52]
MKMKKGLLMVVLLLALSSIMAAMSYNKATVTSASALKVVNTNQALLSLEANAPWSWENTVGAKDKTAVVKDGELYFEFGKGINGGTGASEFYGLQPNSVYEWSPLFTLRNKSAETLKVTIKAKGPYAKYITLGTASNPRANAAPVWGTKGQPLVLDRINKEVNSGQQ